MKQFCNQRLSGNKTQTDQRCVKYRASVFLHSSPSSRFLIVNRKNSRIFPRPTKIHSSLSNSPNALTSYNIYDAFQVPFNVVKFKTYQHPSTFEDCTLLFPTLSRTNFYEPEMKELKYL